jgi:hypothetical protein
MTPDATSPVQCPLCQSDNRCAVAAGGSIEDCWCATETIPPAVLARVPAEAAGKACVCSSCVRAHHEQPLIARLTRDR